ncbi:DUF6572 domain-containing protein [Caulobacter sp. NIBR1757]|uniref:DUF6572 domain-containing protein n=1 Tax=Caulobacter sp. NIBR1757 TaxID=3016000 RepID=UPI0022EFD976|nr:DUF6572 domain-containing protein [Caulobacter sp. NIBR1757]
MTIENAAQIDAMGLETSTGKMVLGISDHLDWSEASAHLQAMERKVNAYLGFIQSGQIVDQDADAKGRPVKIAIYQEFPEPSDVTPILNKLAAQLGLAGIELWRGHLPPGY